LEIQGKNRISPAQIGDILVMEKDDWLIGKVSLDFISALLCS